MGDRNYNFELELINKVISIIDDAKNKEKEKHNSSILVTCKNEIKDFFKTFGIDITNKDKIKHKSKITLDKIVDSLNVNNLDVIKRSLNILKTDIAIEAIDNEIKNLKEPELRIPIEKIIDNIRYDWLLGLIAWGISYFVAVHKLPFQSKIYLYLLIPVLVLLIFIVKLIYMFFAYKYYKEKYKKESEFYYNKLNYLENRKRQLDGFN